MGVPRDEDVILSVLRFADGGPFRNSDAVERLADEFQLTPEEKLLPAGRQTKFAKFIGPQANLEWPSCSISRTVCTELRTGGVGFWQTLPRYSTRSFSRSSRSTPRLRRKARQISGKSVVSNLMLCLLRTPGQSCRGGA